MGDKKQIEGYLRQSDYFSGLDQQSLKALSAISLVKELRKNDSLFHEGQKGFGFFLLVAGAIHITRVTEDGKEITIKILKPGEVFGEVVLFEHTSYPARARAMVVSSVVIIPRQQIHCLLEDKEFRGAFLGLLLNKLRYLTDRMLYLTAHDVEERFFLFIEEHYGKQHEYNIDMTKKDLAAAVGTNPETLSRLINRLENEGRIEWRKKRLIIM